MRCNYDVLCYADEAVSWSYYATRSTKAGKHWQQALCFVSSGRSSFGRYTVDSSCWTLSTIDKIAFSLGAPSCFCNWKVTAKLLKNRRTWRHVGNHTIPMNDPQGFLVWRVIAKQDDLYCFWRNAKNKQSIETRLVAGRTDVAKNASWNECTTKLENAP